MKCHCLIQATLPGTIEIDKKIPFLKKLYPNSEIEKKDLPLPAAKPMAKAKSKYIDIAIRAICQANILFFFLINFNKNY